MPDERAVFRVGSAESPNGGALIPSAAVDGERLAAEIKRRAGEGASRVTPIDHAEVARRVQEIAAPDLAYFQGSPTRSDRNVLAEAFIRGVEAGAEDPTLAGDGDAMYAAFRAWSGQGATVRRTQRAWTPTSTSPHPTRPS